MKALLDIVELEAEYRTPAGRVRAVDGISLTMAEGENLGLVGESGCGKSSVIRCIIQVFPKNFRIARGNIFFRGRDLVPLSYDEMRTIRWKEISYIPQSAMNALNPVYRVEDQIVEVIVEHDRCSRRQAIARTKELLHSVGMDPERARAYPHQLSGGMRQRVNIALALALEPVLIIADEPTTALDVVLQDQILRTLRNLQERTAASLLLVTHDLALVAESCQWMAVMYAGKLVERGRAEALLSSPYHPYTLGLKNTFPRPNQLEYLVSIPGTPPSLLAPPSGCRFALRCPFATGVCVEQEPLLVEVEKGHFAACHHMDRIEELRARAGLPETWAAKETPSSFLV